MKIKALLDLITEVVDEEGQSWQEKRDAILEAASEAEKVALDEFSAWFDPSVT